MSQYARRRKKLRAELKRQGIAAMLVTDELNVTYLSGFSGDSSYLLVLPKNTIIISDFRYIQEIEHDCPDIDSVIRPSVQTMVEASKKLITKARVASVALEGNSLSLGQAEALSEVLPSVNLVTTSSIVEKLREIKDREEIATIRKAVKVAQKAFDVIKASLTADQTEKEIAFNLEHQIRQFGGRGTSFDPIVAVGPQAALPHAQPGEQQIGEDNFCLFDWGANYDRYLSDNITEVTVVVGTPVI